MCQQHRPQAAAREHRAIHRVLASLDEKNRRRLAGMLALQWGHGGVQRLIEITGLSRNTIVGGYAEVQQVEGDTVGRVRRAGGGRQAVEKNSR
jgi:hypothetical protein